MIKKYSRKRKLEKEGFNLRYFFRKEGIETTLEAPDVSENVMTKSLGVDNVVSTIIIG